MKEVNKDTHFRVSQLWKGCSLSIGTDQEFWQLEDLTSNIKCFREDIHFYVRAGKKPDNYVVRNDGLTLRELNKLIELNEKALEMHELVRKAHDISTTMEVGNSKMTTALEFTEHRVSVRLDKTILMLQRFAPVGCEVVMTDEPAIRFVEKED